MYKFFLDQNLLPTKIQKNMQRNSACLDSESYLFYFILNWYRS